MIKVMAKPGEICAAWWHTELGIDTGSARKTRSELRRAETTLAALGVTAVHELNSELVKAGYDLRERKDGADRLALIARVLAHVTEPIGKPLARSLGDGTPTGSPPPFSRIRFDSLIRTEKPSELVGLMVRALRIINLHRPSNQPIFTSIFDKTYLNQYVEEISEAICESPYGCEFRLG